MEQIRPNLAGITLSNARKIVPRDAMKHFSEIYIHKYIEIGCE